MTNPRNTAATLLAEALGIEASAIDDATEVGTTPGWDSLAHMRLILALEERLGRPLSPEEIVSIAAFPDVLALVDAAAGT